MGVERLGAFPSYARMLLLLSMLASIAPISIDMYLPAFANLQRDFHASEEAVQGTLGAYMLCYALMLLLYGGVSDAVGRRPVLLWSSAVYALGAIGAALAPTLEYFYVGRMVQGMSAGAGVVIAQAIVRDCYSGQRAQQAMSYLIIISLSPAIAPVIGGYMVQYSGWRLVFAALVGLIAPHMARFLGFTRSFDLLMASGLIGGCIMIWADWIGRQIIFPYEVPAGVLASVLGGTYFIWHLWRRKV